jgi:hypothetical protein
MIDHVEFWIQDTGYRVHGIGYRVQGYGTELGFNVWDCAMTIIFMNQLLCSKVHRKIPCGCM